MNDENLITIHTKYLVQKFSLKKNVIFRENRTRIRIK